MSKMEFKNGFQSRFDEIDKEDGVFYHVKDSKKIYLDDMVLDDSENIKNDISDYVDKKVNELKTNTDLKLFCIEPIVIKINGEEKTYEGNSYVNVMFKDTDVFEIIPTSNNSIYAIYSYPGALGTFYDWLEGVNIFDSILFNMNDLAMYEKWNQGHQGQYHVQYAQYVNCIFWSDNAYVSNVAERTNYTLYYSSQMPLCYSTIPENTFKPFYLAYSVTNDPNWSNKKYIDSFAQATWATQVFSYYGARTIGMYDMDSVNFNITLPKDCRGLMYSAPSVRYAGVFDAINVTSFGAKSGSWRDAFGSCYSLETLFIKNLKVNINVSWSPIDQRSIEFILSNAINTSKITISLSPYTYYRLTDANKTLASEKNITLELIEVNADDDNRLKKIITSGDGTKFLSDDGTYKDLSNYATDEELSTLQTSVETSASSLNSKIDTVNSSLQATIESNVNTLNSNLNTTKSELNNTILSNYNTLDAKIDTKQDTLVSGENIKTVGGEQVIGSGNIVITPQQAFTVDKNILSVSGHSGYEWIGKRTSEKKNVLWIGTSIPAGDIQFNNNGTTQSITSSLGSNNYPKMIADRLGWNLYNNSRGASFVCFYPSSDDGTNNWAGKDWTEYQNEIHKGYSLSASMAQVEAKFGPNGLNIPEWLLNNFKSYSYESLIIPYIDGTLASCDTVILDHGYNDRNQILSETSWHIGEGEQMVIGSGRDWLLKLQDPFEKTLETESFFQGKWWNDENAVDTKRYYWGAMILLCKKIWNINPRIQIIIGNYFAKKSNIFGAEYGNDKLGEFICLANSSIANWLQVKCVNVANYTGIYNRNVAAGNDYQIFCPDNVHPHSDSTGTSNRIIADIYCRELGSL